MSRPSHQGETGVHCVMQDVSRELVLALSGTPTLSADIVRASWRRCSGEYRLDRALSKPVARMPEARVRELRAGMDEFLHESSPVIDRVRRMARDVNYVVMIGNSDGVVVSSFADSSASKDLAGEGLATGSVWQEDMVGTNGIGTALISRQPITVCGPAHYNESFKSFICSAAPIFAPDGSVLGVFDMSGRAITDSADYNFAQYFTREAAAQISMTLFRKWHKNDCIITLSNEADPMPLTANALVATNEEGVILGATQDALSYLGVPDLSSLGGRAIKDILHVSFGDLKPLSGHSVRLNTPDGKGAFVTAFMPKKKSASASRPAANSLDDKRARLNGQIDGQIRPLDKVAGADPAMIQSVKLCRKIIDKDIPLLILGETGVGKDTLARAIHSESLRAGKPYVAVNCAAIPATLLASELFGYAPGTFTGGAKGGRTGKIVASHGGTLFLDEIGDMPLELQAHLLRVLEERTVTPLGSADAVPVDMKIICATHRNLGDLIAKGHFRKDLYYRIRGAQIVIPCLRDREDLAALVNLIVRDETSASSSSGGGTGGGTGSVTFSQEVLNIFRRYPWPGNIRELRNVIRFILSLHASESVISVEHLPEQLLDFTRQDADFRAMDSAPPRNATAQPHSHDRHTHADDYNDDRREPAPAGTTLLEANEAAERRRIMEVLRTNRWNVTEAAVKLGVSRATLHRKIRRYAITSPNNQI
jgi:sigma-54 dependent transcriptional regulator, acetoin dehydrogenase operon transcriptional activator AcoR